MPPPPPQRPARPAAPAPVPPPPRRGSGIWLKAAAGIEAGVIAALLIWVVSLRSETRMQSGEVDRLGKLLASKSEKPLPPPPAPPVVPPPPPAPTPPPPPPPLVPDPPPQAMSNVALSGSVVEKIEADLKRVAAEAFPGLLHIVSDKGQGSGFLIDAEGHGVSNAHVVEEAREVKITFVNGATASAKVLARDYELDLALLKVDLRGDEVCDYAKPMELGDSDTLKVGQIVMALGSPRGFSRSACMGIVGNLHRFSGALATPRGGVSGLRNTYIQSDAPIDHGNSGGPLLTLDGRVVGVNTRGEWFGKKGVALSVPINLTKEVIAQLKALPESAQGQIDRTTIGADLAVFSPDQDENEWAYKLEKGVKVRYVFPDSPAAEAGILKGDILTRIAGEEVSALTEESVPSAYRLFDRVKPGEEFEIEIQRKEPVTVRIKGLSALAFYQSIRMDSIGVYARAPYDNEVRGQQGAVVTGRIEEIANYDAGAEDQFHVGDVIKKVDGVTVPDFDKFHTQMRTFFPETLSKRTFEVIRDNRTVTITYPYEKHRATGKDGSD